MAEDEAEAENELREALRHTAVEDSHFEQARTELVFGQALRRRPRPSGAREHLRNALEGIRRFEAPTWTALASAELRASGDHPRGQPDVAEALTPQQLQIARLAAAGATNREVAAQMSLSQRTVDHHMRNIFARLDIRSRVELTKLMAGSSTMA